EILVVVCAGQGTVSLVAKLRLVFFLGGFHSADGDIGAGNLVPPAIQAPRHSLLQNRHRDAEISQLLFPTLSVTFLRLGHPQQNTLSLFVTLAGGEIPVNLRGLHFRAPVPPDDIDRLGLWAYRWLALFHCAQLPG